MLLSRDPAIKKAVGVIRDLFYQSKVGMYDLFKMGMSGAGLDLEGFRQILESVTSST